MTASTLVIGLAGGTGSGKTTIADALLAAAGPEHAVLLPQDAWYHSRPGLPFSERELINYDEPGAFDTELLIGHLDSLRRGQAIERPVYDFGHHDRAAETVTVPPAPIVILEGILVLHEPDLRDRLDLKVFVDAPPDERFIRRLQRDVRERSRTTDSVISQYRTTVRPMHDLYVQPSKQHADLIVPEGGSNLRALNVLAAFVREYIRERK